MWDDIMRLEIIVIHKSIIVIVSVVSTEIFKYLSIKIFFKTSVR